MSAAVPKLCSKCSMPLGSVSVWIGDRAYHVECCPHPLPYPLAPTTPMTIAKLIEALRRVAKVGFGYDITNPDRVLLNAAADRLASSQEEIARLTRERDEALRLADWSAVENNTIVNQVWELLGGPDATREGGQSLVNRVKERLEEIARLRKALAFADEQSAKVEALLEPHITWEPGTIRICPMRDGPCPHGMACPFVGDGYYGYPCKDGWKSTFASQPEPEHGGE